MQIKNYQPTGIYRHLTQNSNPTNNQNNTPVATNNNNNNNANNHAPEFNKKKIIKFGTLVAVGAAVFGLIRYYKKGVGFIKGKDELMQKYGVSKLNNLKEKLCLEELADNIKKEKIGIWEKGTEFSEGVVGKIHKGLSGITNFIQKHFYNY